MRHLLRPRVALAMFALIFATPALAQVGLHSAAETPGLRLMNDTEFDQFLKRLDADIVAWEGRLKRFHVQSLGAEPLEEKVLRSTRTVSMRAIENTRNDIQALTRQQTLKLDLMLLVDLNGLARSLDRLGSDLTNPLTVHEPAAARKSLSWAREVLAMDTGLTAYVGAIQQHALALAGVLDAAVERAELDTPRQSQNK